jgi:phosphoglycerol transferase MdoB-like AlkP superfamily enzyme
VAPAVARRRPAAVFSALAGAVAVVYVPHVLAVGAGVLGYVPGYLHEEGYADGDRFALLTLVLPTALARLVAVAVLAAVGLVVLRTADASRPWLGATVMLGASLLVAAPTYPWYALLLVAMVALGGGAWWLAVAAAGYVAQYGQYLGLTTAPAQRVGYGVAALVLAAVLARSAAVLARSAPETVQAPSRRTTPDDDVRVRPDGCSRPAAPWGPG